MAYEGEVIEPEVWFLGSNDRCKLIRTVDITRMGEPWVMMVLIPEERVKFKYKMKDKDKGGELDFEQSEFGAVIMEYPDAFHDMKNYNPENPVVKMWCNYDGSEFIANELVRTRNDLKNMTEEAVHWKSTARRLRIDLKKAGQEIKTVEGSK